MRKIFTLLFAIISGTLLLHAQKNEKVNVIQGKLIRITPKLADLKIDSSAANFNDIQRDKYGLISEREFENEEDHNFFTDPTGLPKGADPAIQKKYGAESRENANTPDLPASVELQFDGIGFTGVSPADPTLCVGQNHVIQMINGSSGSYFKIFNKDGTTAAAQIYLDQLPGAGFFGQGDPIALYDQLADRYILTEFGNLTGSGNPTHLLLCISQTNDPTGAWVIYRFETPGVFPDYPHWAVWNNAYYATTNTFAPGFIGCSMYAFDRAKILAGDPSATMQSVLQSSFTGANRSLAPVSLLGSTAPAANSPGLFAYYNEDDLTAAPDVDSVGLFTFLPDFATPANTVISRVPPMVVAPFKSNVCAGRNCAPGCNGSSGYDVLSNRIMHHAYLRRFPGYDAITLQHTVDAGGGQAATRWYELRNNGGGWSVYQQSTFAPDATNFRYMPSMATNAKGQICLAYNISGNNVCASIGVTGRNATDPLNTMTYDESVATLATGYGTFGNRWGDYNDMNVDPTSDSTFWFTAMYGQANWNTRILKIKLQPLAPTPTVTIDQAAAQPDPTSVSPINFTVVFSEAVTGFTDADVTLSGTAGATTAVVSGAGPTYNVAVSGMTGSGTVIATIPANVVTGTVNVTGNSASTSTDNSVQYNNPLCVTPTVDPVANQEFCNTASTSAITFSGTVPGTVFTWTNSTPSIGLGASGTGNIASFVTTNTGNVPVVATITVTPTLPGCPDGIPTMFTITVNPTPIVDPIANQTVCNGTMTAPVNFTSTIPNTTYTWTNNTPSIGLAASGTGNIAAFTATNATLAPVTATVTVTPSSGTPETTIPLPPQASTFTGNVRGYWFTAPTSFTMTSLFVPTTASTGPQNIAVVRFNGATPPPIFPATTEAFSTLFLTQVNASATAIPVNITINAGDVIGILGNRVNINSYASTTIFSTTIAGFAVPLTRMGMQFPLATTAPQSIFGVNSGQISRVEFSYSTGCAGPSETFDITVNPTPTITCPGNITMASNVGSCNVAVPYTVTATGAPTPTFSYVLTGATTGSGAGTGTGSLFNVGVTTVTVTATNICGAPSCTFTVTVTDSQLPVINTQPANRTVCVGSSATFSVAAVTAPSAGGPLSYQWQMWNPATSTWSNIAGATASSYTVSTTTLNMNTNSFRVNVIGLCTTITSNHATLYVNPLPTINLTTSIPPDLLPTQVLTITATVSPAGGTYVWRKDGVTIAGATGNTLSGLTVDDAGTYSVVYTDLNGCVSTSSNVVVRAQASDNLYVYPVPNRGVFNVRFYNQTGESVTVRVFDAKGSEVYQRKSATTLPYTTINVDMTTRGILAAGVYVVEVRGADARLIGTKKIIVHNN